ncbi:MAG: hypothetical protein RL292_280 [Candidatus Parcubacteria bacterium]
MVECFPEEEEVASSNLALGTNKTKTTKKVVLFYSPSVPPAGISPSDFLDSSIEEVLGTELATSATVLVNRESVRFLTQSFALLQWHHNKKLLIQEFFIMVPPAGIEPASRN